MTPVNDICADFERLENTLSNYTRPGPRTKFLFSECADVLQRASDELVPFLTPTQSPAGGFEVLTAPDKSALEKFLKRERDARFHSGCDLHLRCLPPIAGRLVLHGGSEEPPVLGMGALKS